MIRCPYCLEMIKPELEIKGNVKVYKCSNKECQRETPRVVVEGQIPKSAVGLVGFSGHGKTVYLTALFYLLKKLREKHSNKWKDYYFSALDSYTIEIVYEHVKKFENSKLPESTPKNFPFPALLEFKNIPHFGDWLLSMYDTAGAVFENPLDIPEQGRFVAKADVCLFIISIIDCGDNWANEMEKLLETYRRAVYDRMHINLKETQKIIVVLTKADEFVDKLPKKLANYLEKGSIDYYLYLDNGIIKELEDISISVREWLIKNNCGGFVKLAEGNFKKVRYTIVSSTGAKPEGMDLATKLKPEHPKRVLDPFLWILYEVYPKGIWYYLKKFVKRLLFNNQ